MRLGHRHIIHGSRLMYSGCPPTLQPRPSGGMRSNVSAAAAAHGLLERGPETMALNPTEQAELGRRIRRESEALGMEFAGIFGQETIDRFVNESLASFSERPNVLDFVPILVRRFARERLRALAQADGLVAKERPEVLFVCVHNAGRSQMAAVLLAARSEGRVNVRSAGSDPAGRINPAVIDAMREIDLDLSQEFPKPLTDEVVRAADFVITMGCGDACPVYPGKRYLDWELDDPAEQSIEAVRRIRDQIDGKVRWLLADMGIGVYR